MNTTTQIANEELITKLQASAMETEQKQVLIPLIPKMTVEEKAELIRLITESYEVEAKAEEAKDNYQKELYKINQEYEKKMNTIVREETSNARKEFEGMEHKAEIKELENIENELNNL